MFDQGVIISLLKMRSAQAAVMSTFRREAVNGFLHVA